MYLLSPASYSYSIYMYDLNVVLLRHIYVTLIFYLSFDFFEVRKLKPFQMKNKHIGKLADFSLYLSFRTLTTFFAFVLV